MFTLYLYWLYRNHIHQHATHTGHSLSISLDYNIIYCWLCNDYVYHSEIEKLKYQAINREYIRKRKREDNLIFNNIDINILNTQAVAHEINNNKLGLRGIV